NARDVLESDLLIGEDGCGDDGQRGVLVSRRMDRAGERASTFDDVSERGGQGVSERGQAARRFESCARACAYGRKDAPRCGRKSRNSLDKPLAHFLLKSWHHHCTP